MSPDICQIDTTINAFLAGDRQAGSLAYRQLRPRILRHASRVAADLVHHAEDICQEVFSLMMENPARFDPSRGSALGFILGALFPEAVRRVRAQIAPPGSPTRDRKRETSEPVEVTAQPTQAVQATLDDLPEQGQGSAEAMEAACDVYLIWERTPTTMRGIILALADGESKTEIAKRLGTDRFALNRRIAEYQRTVGLAA